MNTYIFIFDFDKHYITCAKNIGEALINYGKYTGEVFLRENELRCLYQETTYERLLQIINRELSQEIQQILELPGSIDKYERIKGVK